MKTFEFLETASDGSVIFYMDGETWQEALNTYLENLHNESLFQIEAIYRIEDGKFASCLTFSKEVKF